MEQHLIHLIEASFPCQKDFVGQSATIIMRILHASDKSIDKDTRKIFGCKVGTEEDAYRINPLTRLIGN